MLKMKSKNYLLFLITFLLFTNTQNSHTENYVKWMPQIPKTWDEEALQSMELRMPDPAASPKYISSDYYYRIPVRPVYKTYPVYFPEKEPSGYFDRLKSIEPEILFDASKLRTKEDWIQAGELVFQAT